MEEKIRVFLADSWVIFREGMHFILDGEEDIEVDPEKLAPAIREAYSTSKDLARPTSRAEPSAQKGLEGWEQVKKALKDHLFSRIDSI